MLPIKKKKENLPQIGMLKIQGQKNIYQVNINQRKKRSGYFNISYRTVQRKFQDVA